MKILFLILFVSTLASTNVFAGMQCEKDPKFMELCGKNLHKETLADITICIDKHRDVISKSCVEKSDEIKNNEHFDHCKHLNVKGKKNKAEECIKKECKHHHKEHKHEKK